MSSLIMNKVCLVLLTALIFSCSSKNAPDLVLVNGKIWTGVDDSTFEEAVAIKDNKIVAIGKTKDITDLVGSETQTIDLKGKLVTAGFNDAHIHFLSGSLGLAEVDMTGTKTPEEITGRVNQ